MRPAAIGLVVACLLASPVRAQVTPVAICRVAPGYLVITRQRADDIGEDVLVRRQSAPIRPTTCVFDPIGTDYRLADREVGGIFVMMAGRFLLMDNGTGAARSLTIDDVEARRRVLAPTPFAADRRISPTHGGVAFWAVGAERRLDSCPNLARLRGTSFAAATINLVTFRFAELRLHRTRRYSCAVRE